MTDHLIEAHAYRRIAFLAGPEGNEDAHWRELGYRESVAAHGLPLHPGLIRLGGFDEQVAFQTVADWVAEGPSFDAIFAADDESAYGAIRALQQAGLRVPEDVPVVGFDDSPASRLFSPPLTTVRAPIEQAGRRSAVLLGQLIRSGDVELKVLLPTELVVRRSCGCSG
jgi:DNA-binding LacI/PurR family transcriptional regulator